MKKFLLLSFISCIAFCLQAQYKTVKELPDNLMTAKVLLTMNVDDNVFETVSEKVIVDLKLIGIEVVEKYNMSDNPTKAMEQRKELEKTIQTQGIGVVVGVNFVSYITKTATTWYEKEKAFITITDANTINTRKPELYMIKQNYYLKALESLKKQVSKQFKS